MARSSEDDRKALHQGLTELGREVQLARDNNADEDTQKALMLKLQDLQRQVAAHKVSTVVASKVQLTQNLVEEEKFQAEFDEMRADFLKELGTVEPILSIAQLSLLERWDAMKRLLLIEDAIDARRDWLLKQKKGRGRLVKMKLTNKFQEFVDRVRQYMGKFFLEGEVYPVANPKDLEYLNAVAVQLKRKLMCSLVGDFVADLAGSDGRVVVVNGTEDGNMLSENPDLLEPWDGIRSQPFSPVHRELADADWDADYDSWGFRFDGCGDEVDGWGNDDADAANVGAADAEAYDGYTTEEWEYFKSIKSQPPSPEKQV